MLLHELFKLVDWCCLITLAFQPTIATFREKISRLIEGKLTIHIHGKLARDHVHIESSRMRMLGASKSRWAQ